MTLIEKYKLAKIDSEEINESMSAGKDNFGDTVEVWHQDGSYFRFQFASLIELDIYGEKFVVVHTEHCGANVFFKDDIDKTKTERMK